MTAAAAGGAEWTSVNAAAHPFAAADLTPRQLAGQRIVCGFDGRSAPRQPAAGRSPTVSSPA